MIPLPSSTKVWLATGHTDMRKGIGGLSLLVQEVGLPRPSTGVRVGQPLSDITLPFRGAHAFQSAEGNMLRCVFASAGQPVTCAGSHREAINRNGKEKLTALLHHASIDVLRAAFFALKRKAAPGVDEVTWDAYDREREGNLVDLHRRLHAGQYRASPSRRVYIPKADGRQRPLGIASLDDKIVQAALVII